MAALPKLYFSREAYPAWERQQETKSEYCTLALSEIYDQVDFPPADLADPNPARR